MPKVRARLLAEHRAGCRSARPRAVRILASRDVTTERVRVDLSGAPQTTLATLYAKALDADFPEPILGDRYAKEIVERIDYDWAKTTITARNSPSVTTRSAHFDTWVRQFLAVHPQTVVLHLGCGLDSRVFRIDPPAVVRWYDVDLPDVIELRKRLYPERHDTVLLATSVTNPGWLEAIPTDRPVLVVAEGLLQHMSEGEAVGLLSRLIDHFPESVTQRIGHSLAIDSV